MLDHARRAHGHIDMAVPIEPTVCSAWVAPDGTWHYVPDCSHESVAFTMGTDSVSLERRGYVHLSLFYSNPKLVARFRHPPTQAQKDAFFDAWLSLPDDDMDKVTFRDIMEHVMNGQPYDEERGC